MQDDPLSELEKVSALADGQLDEAEFDVLAGALASTSQARAAWHSYHVISDVLRAGALPDCSSDMAFVARLRARMAQEPAASMQLEVATVGETRMAPLRVPAAIVRVGRVGGRGANDPVLRWRWLAAAASLAAVAVLGWSITKPGADDAAHLADARPVLPQQAVTTETPSVKAPVMMRDPRLDELLAAHRQYGGASALPTAAGFLRNATFEQPER
ncbi:MAG: sigma-E factor negative regulatory protein [Burkholderiaceae bacterium]